MLILLFISASFIQMYSHASFPLSNAAELLVIYI